LKPRLLGQLLREITQPLADNKCTLILLNQLRRSMDMYSEKYVWPGGMQLHFSSSLTLELSTTANDRIIKDGQRIGHVVNVKVKKSKVSQPHVSTSFKLIY
jgi:RecA/RadA recombinase